MTDKPKDLCDTCAHFAVCWLNAQAHGLTDMLTKRRDEYDSDRITKFQTVRFGVIGCEHYREDTEDGGDD